MYVIVFIKNFRCYGSSFLMITNCNFKVILLVITFAQTMAEIYVVYIESVTDILVRWSFDNAWMRISLPRQYRQWSTCRLLFRITSNMHGIWLLRLLHRLSNWWNEASISSISLWIRILSWWIGEYTKLRKLYLGWSYSVFTNNTNPRYFLLTATSL